MKPQSLLLFSIFSMWLLCGCRENKSFSMVVEFPNEAEISRMATKTIRIYSIILEGENANCNDLITGTHKPGDEGYFLEKEIDVPKPFSKVDLTIKKDTKTRLFFIEGDDNNDQTILRGCADVSPSATSITVSLAMVCPTGFADCDQRFLTGCETDLNSPSGCNGHATGCSFAGGTLICTCTLAYGGAKCDQCSQGAHGIYPDCSYCGDGVVSSDETCDKAIPAGQAGACPETCVDDKKPCKIVTMTGSADNCNVVCNQSNVTDDTDCGSSCTGSQWTPMKCQSGNCTTETTQECDDGNICTNDACNAGSGCSHTDNNAGCNDGNACTQTDTCQAGVCVGANPVVCLAQDQCHQVGSCDTSTGVCSNPNQPDNTDCGSSCNGLQLTPMKCQSGNCTTGTTQNCDDGNICTNDACNAGSGCSHTYNNGAGCNDGNACTQTDTCQAGVCVGGNPVVCQALDQCHKVGTCNTSTGVCSNPIQSNGTQCSTCASCTNGNCGYDSSRNTDCSKCMKCSGLGTCDFQTSSEDIKNECQVIGSCSTGYCNGAGTCEVATIISIAAGGSDGAHTCALTSLGGVKCWGKNNYGQLGDGTTTERNTPGDVNGLSSGISAITAGFYHSCAVTTLGGVKCWGANNFGQLGDGTTTESHTPVDATVLPSGISAIASSSQHNCALTSSGTVKCWGYNTNGQLGNGLMSGFSAISAGSYHSCGLTSLGGVQCWGGNWDGQLGDGTTNQRNTPGDVSGFPSGSGVLAVTAGGWHSCALTSSHGVKCWGDNTYGQLGDNSTSERDTPVDVNGLSSGISAVAAFYLNTCALTSSGGVKCWGSGYGQVPVNVSGLSSGVSAIEASDVHTCVLTSSGGVKCWGSGYGATPVDVSVCP